MTDQLQKIIYTETDEAPALATYSFLPIIKAFSDAADVAVEIRDISLAGRIIANFPDVLPEELREHDALAELGELAKRREANIIKLPNISASIPQMKACIKELQDKGFPLPDYPEEPADQKEAEIKDRYDKVKGSAVNPVLREGNSDRRAPDAVKAYARNHPPPNKPWSPESKSRVVSMSDGDFYANEKSATVSSDCTVNIELETSSGKMILKENLPLLEGEIIDGTFMSARKLASFLDEQIEKAKADDVLFSLHMKATMMKVSDPIIFGHAVKVYYRDVFQKHGKVLEELGVDPNNGIGDAFSKIQSLPEAQKAEIEADLNAVYATRPEMAMVNSDKGITNLHVPSDIIIDASMPAALRDSGKMWGPDGNLKDTLYTIPDRSYAGVYQAVIDDCKANGAYDPTTMGSVSNVGLMAQKAEEYGSHDKTFEIPAAGTVRVIDNSGTVLFEHTVEEGDIWRACQAKDAPIRDWVSLAVRRARATGAPAVFWLDENRAHDAQLIAKVKTYLAEEDTDGLEFEILPPAEACAFSLKRIREGKDTISVTGNVLRDYLTDLFPILEVGTSAKMLSIVPLMNGGGLFETGAGGSAPKHVQQFVGEGHLRWDSVGEFLALAASFDMLADNFDNAAARMLGKTLDKATAKYLDNAKAPSRKVNEIDNRGSHYYLAMYWAEEMAAQDDNPALKERFAAMAQALKDNEDKINEELLAAQGSPVDIGGYYRPDPAKTSRAMRPSDTLNAIIDGAA